MKKPFLLFLIATGIVAAQTQTIRVWPNGVPGAIENNSYYEDTVYNDAGAPRVHHVTDPLLYIYLPSGKKKSTGAVVICPGGAYMRLSIDPEGFDVAKWLNTMGVAGIVLKYRLPSDEIMKDKSIGPLQDVQEAIRIVRRKAEEWNIDPHKIGVMGFSAGGHLASSASTMYNDTVYNLSDKISARPDFSILIYPVISMKQNVTHSGSSKNLLGEHPNDLLIKKFSSEIRVTQETPPAFLVHAEDDQTVPVANSILYFESLKKFSIPSELHIYESGGHGFGLAVGKGTESNWPEACKAWMKKHHWVAE